MYFVRVHFRDRWRTDCCSPRPIGRKCRKANRLENYKTYFVPLTDKTEMNEKITDVTDTPRKRTLHKRRVYPAANDLDILRERCKVSERLLR